MTHLRGKHPTLSSPTGRVLQRTLASQFTASLARLTTVAACSMLLIGCRDAPRGILEMKLENGLRVSDLLPAKGRAALLVYEAAQCFSCDSDLPLWAKARQRDGSKVKIVVTGPVTGADRRALILAHIPVVGVIPATVAQSHELAGSYLLVDGQVIAIARTKKEKEREQLWLRLDDSTTSPRTQPATTP